MSHSTPNPKQSATSHSTSTASAPKSVTVVHEYHAAYNAIIEPDKFVACTRYFVRRWMPLLGDNGTRIVLALRSLGYYNPRTGDRRDGIEIELPELAALVGISLPTLKREFGDRKGQPGVPQNPVLRQFVSKERQYWRDPVTNRTLRAANIYRVKMDDPLHEDDLPRLNQILDEIHKVSQVAKAQNELQKPSEKPSKAHFDPRKSQSESKSIQSDPRTAQSESAVDQNEPTLKDYSYSLENIENTLKTPAAGGVFASLSSEGSSGGGSASRGAACPSGAVFPEGERAYWEGKAQEWFSSQGEPRPRPRAVRHTAEALWKKDAMSKDAP